ncbi:hypothetical protein IJ579_05000 [bacterium]|nr:hypothetical protein [bacterium]
MIKLADTPPAKDCNTYKNDYDEISHCPYSGESDYWVGALVTCKEMGGHLPDMTELANIAKAVYPSIAGSISAYSSYQSASWNTTEVAKLGGSPGGFVLWSSEEYSITSIGSRIRYFRSNETNGDTNYGRSEPIKFICLANN